MSAGDAGAARAVRAVATTHALLGAALTADPARVAAACGTPALPLLVLRLLGARLLLQAGAEWAHPTRGVATAGAAVDATHAASMVALAAGRPRVGRPALLSAAAATGTAVALLRAGRHR